MEQGFIEMGTVRCSLMNALPQAMLKTRWGRAVSNVGCLGQGGHSSYPPRSPA